MNSQLSASFRQFLSPLNQPLSSELEAALLQLQYFLDDPQRHSQQFKQAFEQIISQLSLRPQGLPETLLGAWVFKLQGKHSLSEIYLEVAGHLARMDQAAPMEAALWQLIKLIRQSPALAVAASQQFTASRQRQHLGELLHKLLSQLVKELSSNPIPDISAQARNIWSLKNLIERYVLYYHFILAHLPYLTAEKHDALHSWLKPLAAMIRRLHHHYQLSCELLELQNHLFSRLYQVQKLWVAAQKESQLCRRFDLALTVLQFEAESLAEGLDHLQEQGYLAAALLPVYARFTGMIERLKQLKPPQPHQQALRIYVPQEAQAS